jgi:hypothetical protein
MLGGGQHAGLCLVQCAVERNVGRTLLTKRHGMQRAFSLCDLTIQRHGMASHGSMFSRVLSGMYSLVRGVE